MWSIIEKSLIGSKEELPFFGVYAIFGMVHTGKVHHSVNITGMFIFFSFLESKDSG